MGMFARIVRFELVHQLRQPAAWATAASMALLMFLSLAIEQVQMGVQRGALHINSPYVIVRGVLVMSWFALFLGPILVARVVLRDREEGMTEILGATPVPRGALHAGRLTGAWLAALAVFAASLPAGLSGESLRTRLRTALRSRRPRQLVALSAVSAAALGADSTRCRGGQTSTTSASTSAATSPATPTGSIWISHVSTAPGQRVIAPGPRGRALGGGNAPGVPVSDRAAHPEFLRRALGPVRGDEAGARRQGIPRISSPVARRPDRSEVSVD